MRVVLVFLLLSTAAFAEVKLGSPFGNHMVLQREMKVPIWGTAGPREKITVRFAGQKLATRADDSGHWRVDLAPMSASLKPHPFSVTGSRKSPPIKLDDVLVGEVWICGGQSNMERQLGPRPPQKPIVDWEKEVAAAQYPQIRQLYVKQRTAFSPQASAEATWTVCSPATVAEFSAVGYFFARELHEKLDVPVGIIHSSWGGTPAEAWTSADGLKAFPEFVETLAMLESAGRDAVEAKRGYETRLENWYAEVDPGQHGQPWSDPAFDASGWETMTLPAQWEEVGHPDWDGLAWFRKTFDLPESWKGGDVELRLSAIDDADTTWVNGTRVGGISGWDTPRSYRVAGSSLKPRGNVIAVRVLDTGGFGGIWDKTLPFAIESVDHTFASIPLHGAWQCRLATQLGANDRPPVDATQNAGTASVLYNGMIAPLIPYAIRGATFYQGEANAERAKQYRTLFPALIADWRRQWQQGDFPFLYVQIAPYKTMPPEIREAQLVAARTTKNTAMIVTIDCGDAEDIHPAHKQPVGARLALAARAVAYGEAIEASGPSYESMTTENGRVVLHFSHVGGGLVAGGGASERELKGFAVAGETGAFQPAQAVIEGDTVVVSASAVPQPTKVRYAWANVPTGNLFNRAHLPASPFRTDVDQ
ncbi:MAG: sialate O-acetylesterase [Opitutus sp.]